MTFRSVQRKVEKALAGWPVGRRWRSDRAATYDLRYPLAVCVSVEADRVEVFLPVYRWPSPYEMAVSFRRTRSLPATSTAQEIERAVRAAIDTREATFEVCTGCGRLTPPEQGGSRCHSCMERLDGCVF